MTDINDREFLLGETHKGKRIIAFVVPNTGLYAIKFSPGGQVPEELKGNFTSVSEAQRVVDFYFAAKQNEKLEQDAKSANK